jgi:hypothetical protein
MGSRVIAGRSWETVQGGARIANALCAIPGHGSGTVFLA